MLIYNTTYHVEEGEDKNFLIWMQEHYLPEVENSAKLHRWYQEQGVKLNEELLNIFKDKVIGFPTLMEVIV